MVDYPTGTHFNPRSREGSDMLAHSATFAIICISIHAPAKGATTISTDMNEDLVISIHAPAKGATIRQRIIFRCFAHFNPRSREGSDRRIPGVCSPPFDFNPRSREGSDNNSYDFVWTTPGFQSTLPRRERQHLLTSFRLQYGYSLFHLTNKI